MKKQYLANYIQKAKKLNAHIFLDEKHFISLGYFSKNNSRENIKKEHYTLMYVIEGKGRFIDKNGIDHPLNPGSLILRKPNDIHSIYRDSSSDWLEFFIIIPEYFFTFLKSSNSLPLLDAFNVPMTPQWLNSLMHLTEICLQYGLKNKSRVFPEVLSFLLTIKEKQTQKRRYQTGQNEILEICRVIDENPAERLSNNSLAKKAGFGAEHFRKLFKEIIGCAPQEYIINSRIQKAQMMLIDDKYKLENIAFELGYPDLPSFSRQFKKVSSLSPSDYKRMANEN